MENEQKTVEAKGVDLNEDELTETEDKHKTDDCGDGKEGED